MSTIAEKQGSKREILSKEVGFPMAGRKKVLKGNFENVNLNLTEDLATRLNSFLEENPYTDKTKTIRQAIAEFLDRRQPSEPKRNIA
ncbi:DUF2811 domain-containing protein [Leptospira biflexa]|uniref:DUF2811 domain-containing protein n=1 Tax=Leptospira biflexa TaxID=172 RepID=UPI0010833E3A|nr:DUF2811 domain-containing protein [Leptospira biflexa]TGM32195.1 DUF2811 domain-containing protein [Leptospira biflexa]TGM42172.1 DUF2811 domain-containing protein [Leptospira biflexa]